MLTLQQTSSPNTKKLVIKKPDNQLLSGDTLTKFDCPNISNPNVGLIIDGVAPNWLCSYLAIKYQHLAWIACYNQKTSEALVIHCLNNQYEIGEQLGLIPPFKAPSPTIVMGGPPDSGKSVLAYTLKQTLLKNGFNNQVYLHRVAWDGEGDWFAQMIKDNKDLAIQLSYNAGRAIKPENLSQYFSEQAQLINKMRYYTNLVLLDFGGKPGKDDHLLLDSCTHYILISSSPEKNEEWHNFFQQKSLTPLAVIDSVLSNECEVLRIEPYLHICAGPWEYEQAVIPSMLLETVKALLAHH